MTQDELKEIEKDYTESKLQHICVTWFRDTFPKAGNLLFAVPNGGWRGPKAAMTMRYEGQVNGVADLILLYPSGGKAALCIEMKRPKKKGYQGGTQSEEQENWQKLVEGHGSVYVVCRGLVEFIEAVCGYLNINKDKYLSAALRKYPIYV